MDSRPRRPQVKRARQPRADVVMGAATVEPPPGMRRITVHIQGDGFVSINAYLYGEWAAHEALSPRKGWSVTFLPCGRCVPVSEKLSEARARRLADWLNEHITREDLLDWGHPSYEVSARVHQGIAMVESDIEEYACTSAS